MHTLRSDPLRLHASTSHLTSSLQTRLRPPHPHQDSFPQINLPRVMAPRGNQQHLRVSLPISKYRHPHPTPPSDSVLDSRVPSSSPAIPLARGDPTGSRREWPRPPEHQRHDAPFGMTLRASALMSSAHGWRLGQPPRSRYERSGSTAFRGCRIKKVGAPFRVAVEHIYYYPFCRIRETFTGTIVVTRHG
jgi:hypothetical protein